jgi:hypothetical protein
MNMLIAMVISTLLVFLSVMIHYESLRVTDRLLPHIHIAPRLRMLVVITGMFTAHTLEVWLHAVAFYVLANHLNLGGFGGLFGAAFKDYLYFSTVTYTSLGFGDVYPVGDLRLIAGVETLTGLLMITWSASYTYLAMEKFWPLHRDWNGDDRRRPQDAGSAGGRGMDKR